MDTTIDAQAEGFLRSLSDEWLRPHGAECLACYLNRMLAAFGCDGTLRFARSYREARAPRATALERRLVAAGGFCDCEVLFNVFAPAAPLTSPGYRKEEDEDVEAPPPTGMPPCQGVRRGSTRPCLLWRRWRW